MDEMKVDVDGKKMEALFRIVLHINGRFYVKKGSSVIARGNKGDIIQMGMRPKHKRAWHWDILELAQYYYCCKGVCLRSIMRLEFNNRTNWFSVRLKGKIIAKGKASGIAKYGKNDKHPDLDYFALVKEV